MLDSYSPCPCGSGKKFKWCCQPIYQEIQEAIRQVNNGQVDSALRKLDDLTKQHPDNPEVWGKRAEILAELEKPEEAEQSLDRALELNPNYPFGLFLRGYFRHQEGEHEGALLLYRKAATHCDPAARDLLGEIYFGVGQCEILENRILAAHAAFEIATRNLSGSERTSQVLEQYFGAESPYPPLVRRRYAFLPIGKDAPRERAQAWQQAVSAHGTGKLEDAAKVFERLTEVDNQDAAAWYNLGLARAWLGDNGGAIEAFEHFAQFEENETKAAEAGALCEALRLARNMADQSDYVETTANYQIVNAQPIAEALQHDRRFSDLQEFQQGLIGGCILDREMPPAREGIALFELPRTQAYFMLIRNVLSVSSLDSADAASAHVEERCGAGLRDKRTFRQPPPIQQLPRYLLSTRLPQGLSDEEANRLIHASFERLYEENWLNKPLKSLNNVAPIDAAQHGHLRKKLLGAIRFLEEIHGVLPFKYDFDRLRHKLGLTTTQPWRTDAATRNFDSMNAADLAKLQPADLSDQDLEQAFQAAVRIDARELAERLGAALADRPAEGKDRFPLFQQLAQTALEREQVNDALDWLERGLKHDCEQNEGRRRNAYELKRAQVHLKARQPDEAHEVFTRLLERTPSDLDVLGRAAEGMVSAKKGPYAVSYAERGIQQARAKGDRDLVGYFEELLAAAKRL